MKHISSPDNPRLRALEALAHSGRERRRQGRTLLDGAHLLAEYLGRVGSPLLVAVSEQGARDAEIAALLARSGGCECVLLTDALFARASPVDTPSGVLALIAIPPAAHARAPAGDCVLLDAVQDPGNLGSILRSAAAAGIRDVLLTRGCAQAWSPRVLRAGMGAHFSLVLTEHADPALLEGYAGRIVAAEAGAPDSLFEADLDEPVAWLFGGEGAGLSAGVGALATHRLHIPIASACESLNVAAAAAVCLFEQVRQRHRTRATC
jgi:TrmH family RNA methyltransferase